jgi:hypothetical protein
LGLVLRLKIGAANAIPSASDEVNRARSLPAAPVKFARTGDKRSLRSSDYTSTPHRRGEREYRLVSKTRVSTFPSRAKLSAASRKESAALEILFLDPMNQKKVESGR